MYLVADVAVTAELLNVTIPPDPVAAALYLIGCPSNSKMSARQPALRGLHELLPQRVWNDQLQKLGRAVDGVKSSIQHTVFADQRRPLRPVSSTFVGLAGDDVPGGSNVRLFSKS